MNSRITLFTLLFLVLLSPKISLAQVVLDDVRQDILEESKDEIKSINDEIRRQKRLLEEEKERKKKAYQEKIERAQKIESIGRQQKIISESNKLLEAIGKQTKFKSEKRWRYEELLNIYAEKPIEKMPLDQQTQAANTMLASATTRLVELLKKQAVEEAKKKRGEAYKDIVTDKDLLVELSQYTKLVKRIELSKVVQQEQIVKTKEDVIKSTRELIAALKQKAIRNAELKKALAKAKIDEQKMQFKNFEGTAGLHHGYDNNINADTAFEGGLFIRKYLALNWLPSFDQYFKANLGIAYLADNYLQDQDVNFQIASGETSLKWHPLGNSDLIIQPGFEWSDTHYPNNGTVSTKENKLFLNTKHKFWEKWSQELNYEDSWIANNNNRLARDGDRDGKIGVALEKRRHTIEYNIKFPSLYKTSFKLKQKGARQTSNDAFTDFYDYYTYKIAGEASRSLTEKLYAKANISYEQKDYTQRTVSAHQAAQNDKTYTQKITFFYFLDDDWLVNFTLTRTKVDSNSTSYDYEKMTSLIGAYYSF